MATHKVLTKASSVECGHPPGPPGPPGLVTTVSAAKLKVTQQSVLLEDSIARQGITGCKTTPKADSSGPIDTTCTQVSAVTEGRANKLKVGGAPVILETLKGTSDGMVSKKIPQDLATPKANQNKLNAV